MSQNYASKRVIMIKVGGKFSSIYCSRAKKNSEFRR